MYPGTPVKVGSKWLPEPYDGKLSHTDLTGEENSRGFTYLTDIGNVSQLLSSKHFVLPKNLVVIHGYHHSYLWLASFNVSPKFKSAGIHIDSSFK
jgi:hypothetical protein